MKITLCGSVRFIEQFKAWNVYLSRMGHIVYTIETSSDGDLRPPEDVKETLDLVHLAKIEESECIIAITSKRMPKEDVKIDHKPYIGFSTSREIQWAHIRGKPVFYTHWYCEKSFGERKFLGTTQGDK